MGAVDILVNNAGITRDNISMRLKDEDWDDVMQVNLKAAFNLTQGVMRGMMKIIILLVVIFMKMVQEMNPIMLV